MTDKDSAQTVIESYRKRQQMGPFVIGGVAILLVIAGILVLVLWLTGPNKPAVALFSSVTPTLTDTVTLTPTVPTVTPTITQTITVTSTITNTATATGPFEYQVQEGDSCYTVAVKYKVGLDVLIALNPVYGKACSIKPGDKLMIPTGETKLPTITPVDCKAGKPNSLFDYEVQPNETLAGIANRCNSTVDAILKANASTLTSANSVQAYQVIKVPVNIVTATPTIANTSTPAPSKTPTPPSASPTVTATKSS
jgi:LysM repeat protein